MRGQRLQECVCPSRCAKAHQISWRWCTGLWKPTQGFGTCTNLGFNNPPGWCPAQTCGIIGGVWYSYWAQGPFRQKTVIIHNRTPRKVGCAQGLCHQRGSRTSEAHSFAQWPFTSLDRQRRRRDEATPKWWKSAWRLSALVGKVLGGCGGSVEGEDWSGVGCAQKDIEEGEALLVKSGRATRGPLHRPSAPALVLALATETSQAVTTPYMAFWRPSAFLATLFATISVWTEAGHFSLPGPFSRSPSLKNYCWEVLFLELLTTLSGKKC